MNTDTTNIAKKTISRINQAFADLAKTTGEESRIISWKNPWLYKERELINVDLNFTYYDTLNFERCSESFFKRLCCHLAHGHDSCGSMEFITLKHAYQAADKAIISAIYNRGFKSYAREEYVHHSFELNREIIYIYVSVRLEFPITLFSTEFQAYYKQYKNSDSETFYKLLDQEIESDAYMNATK